MFGYNRPIGEWVLGAVMEVSNSNCFALTPRDLREVFILKYGDPEETGWGPRRRLRFGYYQPEDYYEAFVNKLVSVDTDWIDVGGGASIFPNNEPLSYALSQRVRRLVGVDHSSNINSNRFLHAGIQCSIEDYEAGDLFNLATLRMVAEHLVDPTKVIQALNRLLRVDGLVIVFTPNLWALGTIISRVLPFQLHHPVKQFLWGCLEKDTFPTFYRMNTHKRLKTLFGEYEFEERYFVYLDSLTVFWRFRSLNYLELLIWRILKWLGLRYPENVLLAVYQKT